MKKASLTVLPHWQDFIMKSYEEKVKGGCGGAQSFSRFLVDFILCSFVKDKLSVPGIFHLNVTFQEVVRI